MTVLPVSGPPDPPSFNEFYELALQLRDRECGPNLLGHLDDFPDTEKRQQYILYLLCDQGTFWGHTQVPGRLAHVAVEVQREHHVEHLLTVSDPPATAICADGIYHAVVRILLGNESHVIGDGPQVHSRGPPYLR